MVPGSEREQQSFKSCCLLKPDKTQENVHNDFWNYSAQNKQKNRTLVKEVDNESALCVEAVRNQLFDAVTQNVHF